MIVFAHFQHRMKTAINANVFYQLKSFVFVVGKRNELMHILKYNKIHRAIQCLRTICLDGNFKNNGPL